MPSTYAMEKAAQAWCKEKTSGIVVDPILAEAFAEILDEEKEKIERASKLVSHVTVLNPLKKGITIVTVGTPEYHATEEDLFKVREFMEELKNEKILGDSIILPHQVSLRQYAGEKLGDLITILNNQAIGAKLEIDSRLHWLITEATLEFRKLFNQEG